MIQGWLIMLIFTFNNKVIFKIGGFAYDDQVYPHRWEKWVTCKCAGSFKCICSMQSKSFYMSTIWSFLYIFISHHFQYIFNSLNFIYIFILFPFFISVFFQEILKIGIVFTTSTPTRHSFTVRRGWMLGVTFCLFLFLLSIQ